MLWVSVDSQSPLLAFLVCSRLTQWIKLPDHTMQNYQLIYPMFAMVLLTLSVLIRLFRARSSSVREGKLEASFLKVYQGNPEPEQSAKLARHFANLHEAPVLFYVCCLGALAVGLTKTPFTVLAWVYVGTRTIHTYIHTGKNDIWPRVYTYFFSWFILLAMWGLLVFRIAMASHSPAL